MIKKFYLSILTLTALLCFGAGNAWGAQSLPYNYGFENYNLETDGWTKYFGTSLTSNNNECAIVGAAKKTGSYGFRFSSYKTQGANAQYLISPEFSAPNGLDVTFQYAASSTNTSGETFKVGYSTTTADVSSFTWVDEFSYKSTSWKAYEKSFPAGTKYIAIYYYADYQYRLYVDDFTFAATPSCVKPTSLTISSLRSTTATFTWTKGKDETSWQYVCLPAADALDWSGAATATSATATISGLTAETDYKLYVRSDCGSEQSAEAVKVFATPCVEYATANLPFEENFNDKTAYPDCWTKVAFVSGTTSYPTIYSSNGESGSKSIRFYGGVTGTSEQIAILPPIEEATGNLLLSFWYKNGNASSSYGQFIIGYITDPTDASTFKQVGNALTRNTSGAEVTKFAMTGAPANSFIAIKYAGGSYSAQSAYIDNIKVSLPSSCADPSDVNAVAASPTTATVSWMENGSATTWNLQYSTDNFTTFTTVSGISENPYTLEGLTANTTYKVRVQADCGGEQSDWIASAAFPTPCEAVDGIGWSENFEDATAGSGKMPDCWQKITNNTSYPNVNGTDSYQKESSTESSTKCLYFYGGVNNSSVQIAVLPPFSEATNTLYVTLDYSQAFYDSYWGETYDYSGASYGQLSIGYITDPTDSTTFVAQETLLRVNAYKQASVALTDAPAGSYVAIRYAGGESSGYLFVDNISISDIPSCLAPSGVSGSATAYDKATIAWTVNGTENAWKLQYSSDNGENWSAEIDANTNPFTLTGLSANTDYIVQVKALCGGEDVSSWSGSSAPFPTPCAPVDASDYNENFENSAAGIGKLPDCWQYKEKYSTGYPYVYTDNGNYTSYAYAGSQCLYFQGGVNESSEQSVLLPEMDQPLNDLTLEFYYKDAESAWSTLAKFTVGYIAADGTTFVPIEMLNYADSYTKYTKDLSALPADAKCLAIRFAGGDYTAYGYIDNVRVYPTPTCAAPTGVTVSNETATTANVAWTAGGEETAWKLQLSNDGSTWGDAIDVNANPYTLTGLTPNRTKYYARVKAVCSVSDESPWSEASDPFETECETRSMPFSENFNNLTEGIPTCWDNSEGTTTTPSYKWKYYATGHVGAGVQFDSYNNTEGKTNILKTPAITISEAAMLDFWYMNAAGGDLSVYYSIDGVKQDAALASGLTGKSDWTQVSVNLPNACVGHDVVIMFQGTSNYGYSNIYLDDVQVIEQPACPAINAATLAESNVTAHTATVSWTAGGEENAWNLQYKAAGGEWSDVIAISTTPSYDLAGLAENTVYYVRVQANCGEDLSEWTGDEAFSFPTDCEPKAVSKATPWECNFDDAENNKMPSCWERVEPYDDYGYPYVDEYAYYASSGTKYLYFRTPGRAAGWDAYTEDAILPVFNTEIKNLKVSFSYFNGAATSNYGQLAIGYVVGDAFTQVGELLAQVEDYTLVEREMPDNAPDGARIAIRCIGGNKGSAYTTTVYVDDIVVSLKPTCYVPTALAAAETSDGAVLTWTAGKDENEWSVRYSVKDADEWTVVDDEITATNYTLTGLNSGTTYEAQVKAVCGVGDESEWSASAEFEPVCNAPSALTVTARTQNSATFSWTSNESTWVLQYSADGENWESKNVNEKPYTLNGLTAGQTYQAKIQAACGSEFSNVVEFTTVCAMRSAADLPFSEDFTGIADDALPACWESATAHVESEKLFFRGADEQIVVLPGYDVALNKLSVSFDYKRNNASMQFGYVENLGGEFHSLADLSDGTGEEASSYNADLTAAPAFAGYLAFRYYESQSSLAANTIDNIIVMDKSTLALDEKKDNTQVLGELVEQAQPVTITIKRTIFCDGYFNTLCLPFDLDEAALAASPLAGYAKLAKFSEATVDGGADELQLVYEYATSIEAGVPYLINFPAGENIVNPTFTDVTISVTAGNNVNLGNGITVMGILKPQLFTAGNVDMLFLLGENKLSWAGVTNNLKGFRAYFQLDNTSNAPVRSGMPARIVERQNMPTGIEDVRGEVKSLKVLENNQVIIIRNGVKYSVQGQVISK